MNKRWLCEKNYNAFRLLPEVYSSDEMMDFYYDREGALCGKYKDAPGEIVWVDFKDGYGVWAEFFR